MAQNSHLPTPDFNEKFRGYDIDEVDAYLATVRELLSGVAAERDDAVARAAALEADLQRAQQAAASVAAAPVAAAAAPVSNEQASGEAARMLALASETAERAVSEANAEAERAISEATAHADQVRREGRVEADRVIGEARVTAEQMTQKATEQAAQEYGARRDEILAEIGALETKRATGATRLAAVEARVEEYRSVLASVAGSIQDLLSDPNKMLRPPIPGIELPTPAYFSDGDEAPTSFAAVDQSATSVLSAVVAEPAVGTPSFVDEPDLAFEAMGTVHSDTTADDFEPVAAFEPAPAQAVDLDAFSDADDDLVVDPASFVVDPVETGFSDPVGSYTAAPETHESAPAFDSEPAYSSQIELGGTEPSGFAAPENDEAFAGLDSPSWDDAEPTAAEAWAPGSWSEVAGLTTTDEAFTAVEADYGVDAFGEDPASDSASRATFPSGGLPSIGADRYSRDLDEALNTEATEDEAMARFFEGDDERQTRRFGRRR